MLVGIIGLKRSGKNAIAEYLKQNHNFKIYSFAQPLKDACKILFDFTEDQVNGGMKEVVDERYNTTPRKVMQVFGTELFQYDIQRHIPELNNKIGRGFWTYKFQCWYEKELINNTNVNVVVSDVRFLHEESVIRMFEGKIWRVNRPGIPDNDSHPSENEWKSITPDHIFENNKTILHLHREIDKMLQ